MPARRPMDWNCTLTEERLADILDGALSSQDKAAFASHSAACARCVEIVAQVGGLVREMQQTPFVGEPANLQARILDATLGPRTRQQGSRQWFGWLSEIWQPRFAMGVATVAASLVIVLHGFGARPSKISLNPASLFHRVNRQAHLTYAHGTKFVNDLRVVYEIQSRLGSQPEPISEPVSEPQSAPSDQPGPERTQPPDSDPREKSQVIPHTGRRIARGASELAILLMGDSFGSVSSDNVRRLR